MKKGWFTLGFLLLGGCATQSPEQLVAALANGGGVATFASLEARQEPEYHAAILAGMKHADAGVRWQCVRLAEQWKDITVVDSLLPLLRDPVLKVRLQAARSLCALLNSDEVLPMLQDAQLPVPAQAALGAALLRDAFALAEPGLLDWALRSDHPPALRLAMWQALAKNCRHCLQPRPEDAELHSATLQAQARLFERACELWHDETADPELRCAALATYAARPGPDTYSEILRAAGSPAELPRLREAALETLGCSGLPEARTYLLHVLDDRSLPMSYRAAALLGLGQMHSDSQVWQRLLAGLRDPDPRLREKFVQQLARKSDAQPQLNQALQCELDPKVERAMRLTLQSMQAPVGCP
jgi:HEAT repeat protein